MEYYDCEECGHEILVDEDKPADVDADEHLYLYYSCNHAEVRAVYTDHARDETYEEYGPTCYGGVWLEADYTIYDSDEEEVSVEWYESNHYEEEVFMALEEAGAMAAIYGSDGMGFTFEGDEYRVEVSNVREM